MATLTTELGKPRQNGYRKVMIILSQHGKRKRIPTSIDVAPSETTRTRSGEIKIKSPKKQLILDGRLKELKEKIYELEEKMTGEYITVETMHDYLTGNGHAGGTVGEPDFFQFAEEWIAKSRLKYTDGHKATLNSLEKYLNRRTLRFSEITYGFLKDYCDSLAGMQRAPSKHLGNIRQLFKEAKLYYNTDERTLIHNSPFERFKVPKDRPANKERSVDADTIRKIVAYSGTGLAGLARDCYVLSFFLMGMNSADLYDARVMSKGTIKYNRMKTRTRRDDEAYIEVEVIDEIKPLVKKHKGNKKVFAFSEKYVSAHNFNKAINVGLKKMCKDLGISDITFYSARHSWATIARNDLGIDKGTISDALNHIDEDMEITDRYIKKDFTQINIANRKVADYIFDENIEKRVE